LGNGKQLLRSTLPFEPGKVLGGGNGGIGIGGFKKWILFGVTQEGVATTARLKQKKNGGRKLYILGTRKGGEVPET